MFKQVIKLSDKQKFSAECFDDPKEAEKAASPYISLFTTQWEFCFNYFRVALWIFVRQHWRKGLGFVSTE